MNLLGYFLSLLNRLDFVGARESKAQAEESAAKSGGGAQKLSSIGAHGAQIVIEAWMSHKFFVCRA